MARLIRNIEDSPRPGVPELKVFLGPDAGMLSDGWEMFLPQRTGIVTLPNGIAPWCEGRAWAFEQGGADYGSTRLQLDLVGSGSQPVQILERRARILSRRSRRPGVHRDRPARHRVAPWGLRLRRPQRRSRGRSPRARGSRPSARRAPADPCARWRSALGDARSRDRSSTLQSVPSLARG